MIHYFKEGDLGYSYLESWEKFGGAPIKKWDSSMLPYDQYPILEHFREKKKWSVLSDFLRIWAVIEFGGIYLDCDVELIKPIDVFYDYEAFICMEGEPVFVNAAVTGGHKGSEHHKKMLEGFFDVVEKRKGYGVPIEVACGVWSHTEYVERLMGRKLNSEDMNNTINVDGLWLMPKRAFYPFNWNEGYREDCITGQTYGIHWWKKSWA